MATITKKDEKVEAAVSALYENFTQDEFIEKFIELYPKDWEKIEKSYRKHERDTKPGKTHPMPEPRQYLKNALNTWGSKK